MSLRSFSLVRYAVRNYRIPAVFAMAALLGLSGHSTAQVTINYAYDDLNRLESVDRDDGPLVVYVYDDVSNIESITISNSPDFDGDGIADFADPDDDNDLIPDDVEIAALLNPFDAADAGDDADGDGILNVDEHLLGFAINHYHGDMDDDNDLDLGDLVLLKRIVFELDTATTDQELPGHGDVNLNGVIDVGDMVILRRRYFGY